MCHNRLLLCSLLFFGMALASAFHHTHIKRAIVVRATRFADRPFTGTISVSVALAKEREHNHVSDVI